MDLANVGGTMTGGSTVALTMSGMFANKVSYTTPTHTRLEPRTVDFFLTPSETTAKDPGVARAGLKIYFADRLQEEGCCTVAAGSVIVDVGIRWSLNQPDTLVDEALDYLQSAAFSAALSDAIKKGILPTA
jgi:hypothetical protein